MASRRHGGHNRSFSVNAMSVNPWQDGAPPTVGGISQLTDTQAQLALALTNLLRSPNISSNHQQLPSLLNLPQINPGASYDYQRHNYDYDRLNRSTNRRSRFNDNKMQNRRSRDRRRKDQRKSDGRDDSDKKESKKSDSESRNDSEVKQSEDASDAKRDWKEEKNNENEEETNENKIEENSDLPEKNGDNEEKGEDKDNKNDKKGGVKRNKDGRYVGIPVQYLKCLICEKSMWDGESFEKHLRGQAHQQMCESLEDSYKIQADMMRQSIRLAEERKAIELNRMKRHGKRVDLRKVSHCNMCNFDFYGREAEHRRSGGHQKLKNFLHPRCKRCRVEFPTRIEWEEHRLTPEHIKKTMEQKENGGDTIATIEIDSADEVLDLTLDGDDFEEEDHDPENVILEITDDLDFVTNFNNRIPVYKKARSVGTNSVAEVTGHMCKICNQFFLTQQKAETHVKTRCHFDNFVQQLKNKHSEKVEEEKKSKKHSLEGEGAEDDEGNWKRRKISSEDEEEQNKTDVSKNELYDPMEAEEEEEKNFKEKNDNESTTINNIQEQTSEINQEEQDIKEKQEVTELNQEVTDVKQDDNNVKEEFADNANQRNTRNRGGRPRPGPLSKTRGRY